MVLVRIPWLSEYPQEGTSGQSLTNQSTPSPITGTDPEMLKALRDAVNKQNRIRRARGEEPTPYVINHSSATRPSMAPQSIGPNMPLGSKASTI